MTVVLRTGKEVYFPTPVQMSMSDFDTTSVGSAGVLLN